LVSKIILASSSPRRIDILKTIGLNIEVRVPIVEEEEVFHKYDDPIKIVTELSSKKAHSVWKPKDKTPIVAADTIVYIKNHILGKPKNVEQVKEMLKLLSGKVHEVYTGFTIIDPKVNRAVNDYEVTKVKFRELSEKDIQWYISTGEPFGKAGSYAIQGKAAIFVEWINGDYFNVVGFPIIKFIKALGMLGYTIYEFIK